MYMVGVEKGDCKMKRKKGDSIQKRILKYSLFLSLIPIILISAISYYMSLRVILELTTNSVKNQMSQVNSQIENNNFNFENFIAFLKYRNVTNKYTTFCVNILFESKKTVIINSSKQNVAEGSFAHKLYQYRVKNNLYKIQLAKMIGCDYHLLMEWEKGLKVPFIKKHKDKIYELMGDSLFN